MKTFILAASFCLLVTAAAAQEQGKISGSLTQSGTRAEGATAALLRGKDSATLKLAVVNQEGSYAFANLADGKYLIAITAVGHQKSFSKIVELGPQQRTIQVAAISLVPLTKALSEVTVTARRSLIEQKIDRIVVNVDASITNIGTSALEVLEKSPGISVDRDGNVSLKGKEGVLIMVDGRPTQLGGADLANLLRNMSSNQLDQIEIMSNPPARYDAAGTAGVINIKTKKIITAGYNGSATLGFSQGIYPKTNEGFSFNYRQNKWNLFSDLSHNYRKNAGTLNIQRRLYDQNAGLQNYFDQRTDAEQQGNSYNAKLGADFFASKNTSVGVVINASSIPSSSTNLNTTDISNASKDLESVTRATVSSSNNWKSFSTNLNFRTVLDKKGKELSSDVDFLTYGSNVNQFVETGYQDATGNNLLKADTVLGRLPQDIKVYSGKIDYVQPLAKAGRLEAGIKSSIVNTDNDAVYDSVQNGVTVPDYGRSNHFIYKENINAAYLNLSRPLSKKWAMQLGLRLENTNAKGRQLTTGEDFDRHYTQLFPTAYFQYKMNDKNNFSMNFGRRVRRPNYGSLNPFIRFVDRYTFSQGNPALRPSLSNNIELTHTWNNQITTTLNYTSTTDIIDDIIEQKGQEAYRQPSNIASQKQYGLAVNANTPITKWWTSSTNVNVYNNRYQGVLNGASVDFAQTSVIIITTQQFKLTKTLTGEINGRFRNGSQEGIMSMKSVGFVGAGFSQQVMQGKGSVRLSIRDIFHSQQFRAGTRYGNVDLNVQQTQDTRVVSLGFSYRFSKGKKIAPVKRTTGSAGEEQERVGQ